MNIWIYIIGGFFALLGVWTFVRWIGAVWKQLIGTVNDLASTLRDAAEVAKAYREDVQILKQIAQSAPPPNFGEEPESIIPQQPLPATMPPPYWARFAVKPKEKDAPLESGGDVDVTPTDEELVEQERNESALDFEAQERMKASMRDADQARLKDLAEMSDPGENH